MQNNHENVSFSFLQRRMTIAIEHSIEELIFFLNIHQLVNVSKVINFGAIQK